jgi:CheY-like chemotaxis protein
MPRGRRVLVVEADHDLRTLYRRALIFHGYDVSEANSGYAALQRLQIERPALIVLDLILPGYDGLAVLRDIAAQPRLRQIPVIVVTGSTVPLERLAVARVLRKPIQPPELVKAVQQFLGTVRPEF